MGKKGPHSVVCRLWFYYLLNFLYGRSSSILIFFDGYLPFSDSRLLILSRRLISFTVTSCSCCLSSGHHRVHTEWTSQSTHRVDITEYTQSGNARYLPHIPSWWTNQPWLVRVGCTRPHPFTLFTIMYKVAVYAPPERADTLPVFHHYSNFTLCLTNSM